jgi:hypothetical protein
LGTIRLSAGGGALVGSEVLGSESRVGLDVIRDAGGVRASIS